MADTPASDAETPAVTFESFGLLPELVSALSELGYEEPTPIQRVALPPLLEGRDVIGQAATGTGKTAAFALPILQHLTPGGCGPFQTSALVLVPTRELAMQVAEAIYKYGKHRGVSVLPVYGGQEFTQQLRRLKRGVDVVIATPGRAVDHLGRKTLDLSKVHTVVLDEADEMLDMGFAEDLEAILSQLPEERQTALFSATLPPRIAAMASTYLQDPVKLRVAPEKLASGELPRIRQLAYLVPRTHKAQALGRVLDVEVPTSAIVFCRTRLEVDELTEVLNARGYGAAAIHGGLSQEQRDRVLKRFKGHQIQLLVATDVAARGLHVEKLSHVVNYDLPTSPEVYVHRIGRTGRAGKAGVALSLLEPREQRLLQNIERLTKQPIQVSPLPSVTDLKTKRMELTRVKVQEVLEAGALEPYAALVAQLSEHGELATVAAAALKALDAALNPARAEQEEELPAVSPKSARSGKAPRPGKDYRQGPREDSEGPRGPSRGAPPRGRQATERVAVLELSIGTRQGLRPGDLVGAITNEAGVTSREVGAIQLDEDRSRVEVVERLAPRILFALRQTTLRGRRVRVERVDGPGGGGGGGGGSGGPGGHSGPRSGPRSRTE